MQRIVAIAFFLLLFFGSVAQPLNLAERRLIKNALAKSPMYVLQSNNPADLELLHKPSKPIDLKHKRLWKRLADNMLTTVQHPGNQGVGIAAPQVGINRQLMLVQRLDQQGKPFQAIINPVIISFSDSTCSANEGCLSVPDTRDIVSRPWQIVVEYHDLTGTFHRETVSGYVARIFQHEIDHLKGKLFTDYSKPK